MTVLFLQTTFGRNHYTVHNIPHLDVQKGGQDSWLKRWHRFYNIQQLSEDLIIHYPVGWFCNRLYSV